MMSQDHCRVKILDIDKIYINWQTPKHIYSGPLTDPGNRVRAATKWCKGKPKMESGPYFRLTFLLISPRPVICERGKLYHLNKSKTLLHICKY